MEQISFQQQQKSEQTQQCMLDEINRWEQMKQSAVEAGAKTSNELLPATDDCPLQASEISSSE